ncbi:MAG TPA: hypothetical protein VM692_06855 [Gammaproteobacteria bacterium]|nr:hypothetical protein [Gammaproteobacteria bacterium]
MRIYLVVAGACVGAALLADAAHAQSSTFCSAAGAYMHEVAVRRASGATRDDAVQQLTSEFEAFAGDQADLAARRRVLQVGPSLAAFAVDLDGLRPATVQSVGQAYCAERGGYVSLAPSSTVSRQFVAAGLECESGSAEALDSCVAQGIQRSEVRVARETSLKREGINKIQPFYEFAASYGGDAIGTIIFVGGNTQEVDSGNGLSAGGGFLHRITESFGIKYTASYKVSFSAASNADVMKSVLPIDIVPYYQTGDHRFGVGLSHHLSPKVDWDWLMPATDFDDATGVIVEYAWKRLSFSYTDIDYESGPASIDASHFSVKYTSRH